MEIPFKTKFMDGDECVMPLSVAPKEIRFNIKSRTIIIICEDVYMESDFDGLPWKDVKSILLKAGGKWTSTKDAIKYLTGKLK